MSTNHLKSVLKITGLLIVLQLLRIGIRYVCFLVIERTEFTYPMVMIWKVITGLCFGIALGALRIKTKSIYSTMLLHGTLNIFGR